MAQLLAPTLLLLRLLLVQQGLTHVVTSPGLLPVQAAEGRAAGSSLGAL